MEGLLGAMNHLNLKEGTILTYNQEDEIIKDGKKIYLIPAWKWMRKA